MLERRRPPSRRPELSIRTRPGPSSSNHNLAIPRVIDGEPPFASSFPTPAPAVTQSPTPVPRSIATPISAAHVTLIAYMTVRRSRRPLPLLASSGPSPHSSGVQTGEGKGGRRGEGGRGAGRRGGAGVGIVRQVQGRSSACLSVYHGVSPRPLPSNTRCNIRPRPRLHESMKLKRLGDC